MVWVLCSVIAINRKFIRMGFVQAETDGGFSKEKQLLYMHFIYCQKDFM